MVASEQTYLKRIRQIFSKKNMIGDELESNFQEFWNKAVTPYKVYRALVQFNAAGAPSVLEVFENTIGEVPVWSNVDDQGRSFELTTIANLFVVDKTTPFSFLLNDSDTNRFIIGKRNTTTVYSVTSYNSIGDNQVQLQGEIIFIEISIHP